MSIFRSCPWSRGISDGIPNDWISTHKVQHKATWTEWILNSNRTYMPQHKNIQASFTTGLCLGIWEYTVGQGPWSPHAAGSCAFQRDSPPAPQQHHLLQDPTQEASVDSLTTSVSRTRGMRRWIFHHKCSKLMSLSGEAWSRTACPGTWDCGSTPGRSDSEP